MERPKRSTGIGMADIESILAGYGPELLPDQDAPRAAVALILRPGARGPEALFIERAAHESDPWSGDIGLPGGRVEETDENPRRAAERETLEEIGLDLRTARYLGRLSDIAGVALPIRVSCFVYGVEKAGPLRYSEEVEDAFWIPLAELSDPARHGEASVRFAGRMLNRPSIRLPQPGKPVLWGLTYRLVMQLLELLPVVETAPPETP